MSEVIVVTSGKGGVGKTTTSANIGTGLALAGKKVALAHFKYINPLPANTVDVVKKFKKVVVAEQNLGQFAAFLRMKVDGFVPYQFNEVKGQPFVVSELVEAFTNIYNK